MGLPIKTFLFDMGNVLVRFSHPRMHAQMSELLGLTAEEIDRQLASDRLQWRYEAGLLTTDEMVAHFRRIAPRPFEPSAFVHAVSNIFEPIVPMQALTRRLKAAGYRLVLVSNTNVVHLEFIQRNFDVLAPFDELVASYAIKAMKPDHAFYAAAAKVAGCAPEAALFTDDLAENIEGAHRFGFATAHFTTPEAFMVQLRQHGIVLD